MITPEALAILSKPEMQAFLRERMGPPQEGDRLYIEGPKIGVGLVINNVHPSMVKIRFEKAGAFDDEWFYRTYINETAIRIPLSIDDRNPERGLVGMIGPCNIEYAGDITFVHGAYDTEGPTPLLALLRALEAQLKAEAIKAWKLIEMEIGKEATDATD